MKLEPYEGSVLVELVEQYAGITLPDKKYDTKVSGIAVKSADPQLNGKRVFFEEYKDGVRVTEGAKTYAFIKLKDIRGYENA
jgi:co-chaperonin GroES (HSP10)